MGNDPRGMLGFCFLPGVTAGHQVGRDDKTQRFSADAGAIGNEEVAETEQSLVFLPHGNIEESVGADAFLDIPMWKEYETLLDRKSTRLNSSHQIISYTVFC